MGSAQRRSEEHPRLCFRVLSNFHPDVVGPRIGRLAIPGRNDIQTPNFIAVTSRGVVPHLTPDVITEHTQIKGVHMALEDYVEKLFSGTPPILNCNENVSPLHNFTALPSSIVTVLAPRRTPAVSAPNGNTKISISLFTSTGFQVLSNTSYTSFVGALRPDIAVALPDIPYGVLPGTKRISKMGDRTQEWLSQLLDAREEGQAIFAPVLPIDFHSQSEYLNYLADDRGGELSGLALYDSNLLPEIPATTSLDRLVRLSLDEPPSPHHILRQISLGMDIFTIPFVGFATDAGIALTFRFSNIAADDISFPNGNGSQVVPLGIDMWSAIHATSLLPISASCFCYTCTSHHRAFVQHLLSAKEMLGWVLLQIHNHQVLSSFFTDVRESIRKGTFDKDCEEFERNYESKLPEKSGQGPRARGYHFKTEGPGEGKKNKAAWGNLGGDEQESGGESGSLDMLTNLENSESA